MPGPALSTLGILSAYPHNAENSGSGVCVVLSGARHVPVWATWLRHGGKGVNKTGGGGGC